MTEENIKACAIDYETYYDEVYSLSNMSVHQYVNDPRFDAYLVAIYSDDIEFVGHPKDAPWDKVNGRLALYHNASFDHVVTGRLRELGIIPEHIEFKGPFDTADMAPYLNAPRNLAGASKALLGKVMSKKTRSDMKGKTYQDMVDEGRLDELLKYGGTDAQNTYELWKNCGHLWPAKEQEISRLNFGSLQYGVKVNRQYASETCAAMEREIEATLALIPWAVESLEFLRNKHPDKGITWWDYRSSKDSSKNKATGRKNVQGALSPYAVRAQGEKEGISIPASLAKTSEDWDKCIKEYGDKYPWMRAVGKYRSLNAHYCKASNVRDGLKPDDTFTFQIKYFGAGTGRFSGGSGEASGDKFNPQNMPRGEMFGCDLRHFFIPREGCRFVISDFSQIEARVLLWLAGDMTLAEAVKREGNLYQAYAKIRGLYKGSGKFKDDDNAGYQAVKSQVLGLGYSMGTVRYAQTLIDAGLVDRELKQGEMFKGVKPAKLPPEVRELLQYLKVPFNKAVWYYVYLRAEKEVSEYRSSNPLIVKHWEQHDYWLKKSVLAKDPTHEIALRSNRVLTYYDPQFVKVELQTRPAVKARTEIGGTLKFLHRGLLTNNEVQATSRDILCDAWRAIAAEGIQVLWTVHDEFIIEAREDEAEDTLKRVEELMVSSSPWADGCPLGVESHITGMYLK